MSVGFLIITPSIAILLRVVHIAHNTIAKEYTNGIKLYSTTPFSTYICHTPKGIKLPKNLAGY
jgi:hypothetical protein